MTSLAPVQASSVACTHMALHLAHSFVGACWQTSLDNYEGKWRVMQQEPSSIACSSVEEALHRIRQLLAMLPSSNHAPAPKVDLTFEH